MNWRFLQAVLALGLLAQASLPASAGGDWGGDGYRGYGGGGVPVPAPIPVPIYQPEWYLRIDASAAFGEPPEATESGLLFGEGNDLYGAATTFGTSDSWISSDFPQHGMYGGGIGYRWSDWFRGDITAESMRDHRVKIEGDVADLALDPTNNGLPVADFYDVSVTDTTKIRGVAFLANAYVDVARWGAFTPYVGGGVGFAVARLSRRNDTVETVDIGGVETDVIRVREQESNTDYAFAASATAGVSYAFSDVVELDVAYRYLFIEGMDVDLTVNGNMSKVSVGQTNDHQVRAGLRFNIQ